MMPVTVFATAATPAVAPTIEAPQISFSQQVNIVVSVKRDPRVLDMKIKQDNAFITLDLIVDHKQERPEAQDIATQAIMAAKTFSLDDNPAGKGDIGKGLYDYKVTIARPDGVILLLAEKLKEESSIRFENPAPVLYPLTRAP